MEAFLVSSTRSTAAAFHPRRGRGQGPYRSFRPRAASEPRPFPPTVLKRRKSASGAAGQIGRNRPENWQTASLRGYPGTDLRTGLSHRRHRPIRRGRRRCSDGLVNVAPLEIGSIRHHGERGCDPPPVAGERGVLTPRLYNRGVNTPRSPRFRRGFARSATGGLTPPARPVFVAGSLGAQPGGSPPRSPCFRRGFARSATGGLTPPLAPVWGSTFIFSECPDRECLTRSCSRGA
jgi:hypothetical protein